MVRKIWNIAGLLVLVICVCVACKEDVLFLEENADSEWEVLSDEEQTQAEPEM